MAMLNNQLVNIDFDPAPVPGGIAPQYSAQALSADPRGGQGFDSSDPKNLRMSQT